MRPDGAGKVKEELPNQGTELEDDNETREFPGKVKEELPKQGAALPEQRIEVNKELMQQGTALSDDMSKVKEDPVECTYRPKLADGNSTRGIPDKAKEERMKHGMMLGDFYWIWELPGNVKEGLPDNINKTKEEGPGWDEVTASKVKEEQDRVTMGQVHTELSDKAKGEQLKQGMALEDVNRTLELPDEAKEELPKQGT